MIKDIPGYPGLKADSEGHIIGYKGSRLKGGLGQDGYPRVTVGHNRNRTVHSLVCLAFHGPRPEGQQIRHLDNNKFNSRPSNLRYGTSRENADDMIKYGSVRGSKNANSKLKESDVAEMRKLFRAKKMTQTALSKKYGVSQSCIFLALEGIRVWKHVPYPCTMGTHEYSRGSKSHKAKLNEKKVIVIRKRVEAGDSDLAIAKDYGVTAAAIWNIRYNYTYRHMKESPALPPALSDMP